MQLAFDDITFRYRRTAPAVLERFCWAVPAGRTVLLGPNGAGKTTLLALGADALKPDRGTITAGSLRAVSRSQRAEYRRTIGWMPQQIRSVPGLTVREQVAYAAWLKGAERRAAWELAAEALARVNLDGESDRLASELSGGQLRRVGLAQVLVHNAEVILLDEPTVGLDPAQRATFREILAALPYDRPVVVSTHQVDDLSDLFDTVVILDQGKIRHQSSVAAFLALAPSGSPRPAEAAYMQVVSGAA
jgi:ABC-2 type transport system ATP-binding protein